MTERLGPSQIIHSLAPSPEVFTVLAAGTMRTSLYAPWVSDHQSPHDQDELYIVRRGSAVLRRGEDSLTAATDDVIFVAAGTPHRFEALSDDFMTWVIFWGPGGGENPEPQEP